MVNIGIDELLDRKLGNEPTGAYFPDFKDSFRTIFDTRTSEVETQKAKQHLF